MGACHSGSCFSSGAALPNPDRIDLSHFDLLKVVGKGGFGKVNAITRKSDGQLMALKRMAKCEVIKKESHIRMVWTERNIMAKLSDSVAHPFLVSLEHAFQTEKELYFVMEFMQGGDLRFHLNKRGIMTESECRFYAAEMVLALEAMHRLKVVYRDFKPDNILLDSEGHIRVSDFGLAVQLEEKHHYVMKGNAGTASYLAPEVWAGEYYGVSPDAWSFGIVVYELLHGRRPYRRWNPAKNYIEKMKFHPALSPAARSFIRGLLTVDPRKRLACGPSGWTEVKSHPFFAKIDWNALQHKLLKPPIKPDLRQANCSNQADLADQLIDKKPGEIHENYQKYFSGFDYDVDFAAWQVKNEERKHARAARAEVVKRLKAEHRQKRKMQMEQMLKAGQGVAGSAASNVGGSGPLSPSSSSGNDYYLHRQTHPYGGAYGPHLSVPAGAHTGMQPSINMSVSASSPPAGDYSHAMDLQDAVAAASAGSPPSGSPPPSARPRLTVGSVPPFTGFEHTPCGSVIQGSWQMSASEDSLTQDSGDGGTPFPQTGLAMLMAQQQQHYHHQQQQQPHSQQLSPTSATAAVAHSRPGSFFTPPPAHALAANGPYHGSYEEKLSDDALLRLEDAHILQMTQHAHHAVGTPYESRTSSLHGGVGVGGVASSASSPGAAPTAQEVRMSEEADAALRAFRENHRRERAESKRKHAEKQQMKHRTSLSQALLSIVRAKPTADGTPAGGSPLSPAHPASEEERMLALRLAEMLQKDRDNIRKLLHGDSRPNSEPNNSLAAAAFLSSEVPGRIRTSSAAAHAQQPANSYESAKGSISGLSVLAPVKRMGTPPIFPYPAHLTSVARFAQRADEPLTGSSPGTPRTASSIHTPTGANGANDTTPYAPSAIRRSIAGSTIVKDDRLSLTQSPEPSPRHADAHDAESLPSMSSAPPAVTPITGTTATHTAATTITASPSVPCITFDDPPSPPSPIPTALSWHAGADANHDATRMTDLPAAVVSATARVPAADDQAHRPAPTEPPAAATSDATMTPHPPTSSPAAVPAVASSSASASASASASSSPVTRHRIHVSVRGSTPPSSQTAHSQESSTASSAVHTPRDIVAGARVTDTTDTTSCPSNSDQAPRAPPVAVQ